MLLTRQHLGLVHESLEPLGGDMTKYLDLREAARRQHRALGLYATLYCWVRKWDGVAVERRTLERALGLKKFQPERVKWLLDDLQGLFPTRRTVSMSGTANSLATLYLARIPLDPFPSGTMTTEDRIGALLGGNRLGVLELWPTTCENGTKWQDLSALAPFLDGANEDERLLTAYLALLSSGQIGVQQMPGVAPE